MKDSRFIELLNLYVDREITPAEAAELEAEVQANEQLRRVYNQYCRIDRACTVVLAQGGKVPAPKLAAAIADADRKVEAFPEQTGGRSRLVFLGGMLAAAAAIAVVFYQRETTPASAVNPTPTQNVAQVRKVPSSPIPTGREATVVVPFGAPVVQSASSVRPAFAWMKQELTAVTPLTDDDLILVPRTDKSFSSHLNWGLHESAGFPRAGAARSPTELNAFEISK